MYHSNNNNSHINDDIFSLENEYKTDKPDILKWFYLFLSKWYWFVIFIFLGLSVAYFVNRYTTPVYKVDATVLIKSENQTNMPEDLAMMSGFSTPEMQNFQNQTILLKTESLILKTLERLDFNVSYYSKDKLNTNESNSLKIIQTLNQAFFSKENTEKKNCI